MAAEEEKPDRRLIIGAVILLMMMAERWPPNRRPAALSVFSRALWERNSRQRPIDARLLLLDATTVSWRSNHHANLVLAQGGRTTSAMNMSESPSPPPQPRNGIRIKSWTSAHGSGPQKASPVPKGRRNAPPRVSGSPNWPTTKQPGCCPPGACAKADGTARESGTP